MHKYYKINDTSGLQIASSQHNFSHHDNTRAVIKDMGNKVTGVKSKCRVIYNTASFSLEEICQTQTGYVYCNRNLKEQTQETL